MSNFNGICYQPFPPGYDPSTANDTYIFFGSDIAYDPMEPIWGSSYTSCTGSSCSLSGPNKARNDMETLKEMGVHLLRLYDWEPRNKHLKFLDYCQQHGIKVLAPVSNYFVKPDQGLNNRHELIPALIKSFSNKAGTDFHPAIAGIIIGNEPRLHGFSAQNCIDFTKTWVEIEAAQFSSYREVPIGHPVDFNQYGGEYPCFGFWDMLLGGLNQVKTRKLNERLILNPQSYNDAFYLFENAESSGKGYVDITFEKYKKPLLFTEIGMNRKTANFKNTVEGQLKGALEYHEKYPERLLGTCFFQFADKVWLDKGSTEANFGAFSHGEEIMATINYGPDDFTHWDIKDAGNTMNVDKLEPTALYDIVKKVYTSKELVR
ncbi:glycoside hydrolase 5 family protein [Echinicola salinicaeni]|uniref:hypothetical protein n=1 Tax=Echinicola salinicaeni TaxID=2762757 RepID=UPI0016472312|nr:hypothetical protein [Echinicola salinicaeni]